MSAWNNIYETFDPIAFTLFSMPIHWYGIMYVLALLSALYIGKYFIKKDKLDFKSKELDSYFLYVEIGVILVPDLVISFFTIRRRSTISPTLGRYLTLLLTVNLSA